MEMVDMKINPVFWTRIAGISMNTWFYKVSWLGGYSYIDIDNIDVYRYIDMCVFIYFLAVCCEGLEAVTPQ